MTSAWLWALVVVAGCSCSATKTKLPVADQSLTPELIAENNRGVALMGRFDYARAHDVFAGLVSQRPNWEEAKINLAVATLNRQQQGDLAEAEKLMGEVLDRDPDNLRARYCQGLLKSWGSAPAESIREFERVAQADPHDAYAAYHTGRCLFEEGRYDEALKWYREAIARDPYFRSAYYGSFQTLQRLKKPDEAAKMLQTFERLKTNPQARLVEQKYTRMGPKAEALAVNLAEPPPVKPVAGPVFAAPRPLTADKLPGGAPAKHDSEPTPPSVTVCDLSGDGKLDICIAAGRQADGPQANIILLAAGDGWTVAPEHPLAGPTDVRAALWGDYDNDGLTDVYFCRRGPNQLWRQVKKGEWEDVTEKTNTAGGDFDTVDGAFADLDHDGDLDLFLVRSNGPNELLNNNLDGTFRSIAADNDLAGDDRGSRGVLVADLDADRDADVIVIKRQPPHEVYRNDRLWTYRPAEGFDALRQAQVLAAVAADADADGQVEIYALSAGGLSCWKPDAEGQWQKELIVPQKIDAAAPSKLAIADLDGDGLQDALFFDGQHLRGLRLANPFAQICELAAPQPAHWKLANWELANLTASKGPAVIGVAADAGPQLWPPGSGRHPLVEVVLTGKQDEKDQTRSNTSGIGVKLAARVGSRWTATSTYRDNSGPGQSLQPLALGLGDSPTIDFVAIDWTDGVFQTELDLKPPGPLKIEEIQRQVSSCPVVFAWNGQTYQFVTDVLGVGGLGFATGRGTYAPTRPRENLLLPAGLPVVAGGKLRLKIAEPMEEICYLDSARLVAYDLPPGWQVGLDERMATGEPAATGERFFYRQVQGTARANNDRGEDVTALVAQADRRAAWPGQRDRRFIGRTAEHAVTLALAEPVALDGRARLLADGWLEYPYSQTMFAAWQAGASYNAPTLEACDESGGWHTLAHEFGYPAGMSRQMSLPLPSAGFRATALRLRTNLEVYWDRLAVVRAEPCPQAGRQECALTTAELDFVGFPKRSAGADQDPHYDYRERTPFWDTRHPAGWYTAFGSVEELITASDGALAIFGPGEEVGVEFAPPPTAPPAGWTRQYVLELAGWCKDMDLYTRDGETVDPLPQPHDLAPDQLENRKRLHRRFQTRYQSGR